MSLVYKNTTSLSFDEFIRDLHVAFEMSESGQNKMWDASKGRCLLRQSNELRREQLHPGQHLLNLTRTVLDHIEQRLHSYDVLATQNLGTKKVHEQRRALSLYSLCTDVLVPAASVAFFGKAVLRINPHLVSDFLAFDEDS